jgi:hypothetical protein
MRACIVQLAGECANNFHLYMPGSEDARLKVGHEFILSDIDEGPPTFPSTDLPLGGRNNKILLAAKYSTVGKYGARYQGW